MNETTLIDYVKPVESAFICKQMDLFQSFLCNNVEQRKDLSNAIPLWDCLPKYALSKQSAALMRKKGTLPSILKYTKELGDRSYLISIQPARVECPNGDVIDVYPGANEEIIEEALRLIFAIQNQGFYEESQGTVRTGVTFTIYQLREKLKDLGHSRSHGQVVESLQILKKTNIDITVQGMRKTAYASCTYLTKLVSQSRDNVFSDPDAKWYVEFHPLIAVALNSVDYRQYNITTLMRHSSQIARWIHKYFVIKFTFASINNVFEIRYSTIAGESHMLTSFARKRDAIRRVCAAFDELKKNNVISSCTKTKEMDGEGNISDIVFVVRPSMPFIKEVKASNKCFQVRIDKA